MSITQKLFQRIHNSQLIYNICWEDPEIDRALMQLNASSKIAMITSAGCNALCYLIDKPALISCVDLNYRQNAVLDLKTVLIKHTNHQQLFNFFGKGFDSDAKNIYAKQLRPHLRDPLFVHFWDQHIKHIQEGTYHYSGTSGLMAKWIIRRMKRKKVYPLVQDLITENKPSKRTQLFNEIFYKTFPRSLAKLINSNLTMSMLGVPRAQKKLIEEDEGSVYAFIEKKLRHVFTQLPNAPNYFWKFYLKGGLSESDEAPSYLKEENFEILHNHIDRIAIHTLSLEELLSTEETSYSHFVLLDHQDWMANHRPDLLQSEWEAIFRKSIPQASYLLRSASKKRDFLPNWVQQKIQFNDELAARLHSQDRVGTYASTHYGSLIIGA